MLENTGITPPETGAGGAVSYRTLWLSRDRSGALWLSDDELIWLEELGRWLKPDVTLRSPKPPNTRTWLRKMPPSWFPEVKPGEKMKARLSLDPETGGREIE